MAQFDMYCMHVASPVQQAQHIVANCLCATASFLKCTKVPRHFTLLQSFHRYFPAYERWQAWEISISIHMDSRSRGLWKKNYVRAF